MKSKLIYTGTTEIFIIELPDLAVNVRESMGYIIARIPNYNNWISDDDIGNPDKLVKYLENHKQEDDYKDFAHKLPDENWKLLCKADEVKEDTAKAVIEYIPELLGYSHPFDLGDDGIYDTALESWESLLRANEIYFSNPIGERPDRSELRGKMPNEIAPLREYSRKWAEAQENVWDINRTYIFKQQ